MKNQELFGVYSRFERFVSGYVVAVIRLLPEGYPSVESRLLRVIRGQAFPLAPEAFAKHLEKNSELDSPRDKVIGAMSELLHLLVETVTYLGKEAGRDLAHRPLLFMSEYGEADERAFALLTLARLGHATGREQLPHLLGEWSRTIRWAVLSLLEREGDWHWMSLFLSCLEDGEPEIVRVAVSAIGKSGTVSAAPRVLELLHGSGEAVTIAAALALGRLREPAALLPLMELGANTRSQKVRASVVSALGEFGEPRVVPFLARNLEQRDARV
ncbi:MAG TPA: HEAT repeat domain-containing protein, partial [Candidatus Ozemobacteraceae bacterium]|nr:HEAT repeat domain-containing protein [Candidatus Ozemobacteraceae bacterium]